MGNTTMDFAQAPLDRLVAKETALGTLREIPPPRDHIGLSIAPFEEVVSDDVIFDFLEDSLQEGLAPARAQDAESELAQKDDFAVTQGRARLIDWTLKSTYDSSKVMSYRDTLRVLQAISGQTNLVVNSQAFEAPAVQFRNKIARDDAWRRGRLDNRIEHMIMTSVETSKYLYNDGKINFAVDFKRPSGQQDQNAPGGWWDDPTSDPIADIDAMNETMFDTYGIQMKRAITSKYALRNLWRNEKFTALTGLVVAGTPLSSPIDVRYLRPNWGVQAAIDIIQEATGVTFEVYDSVYRTRAIGSTTGTNVRFTSSKKVIFLPAADDLAQVDPDGMGFAKTLTSPHAEGNWTAGFYEWEKENRDPWTVDRGTGIKAFPIFPFMKYSYVMKVLA